MVRNNTLEKILMLGKIEARREKEQYRMRCLDAITYSVDMGLNKFGEIMKDREAPWAAVHVVTRTGHYRVTEQYISSGLGRR